MSKKIVQVVQKNVTVNVCDVCAKELPSGALEIDFGWGIYCPSDGCFDDWGDLNFCSFSCVKIGAKKITNHITHDEDFYLQTFTIQVRSVDQEDDILPNILKLLTEEKPE